MVTNEQLQAQANILLTQIAEFKKKYRKVFPLIAGAADRPFPEMVLGVEQRINNELVKLQKPEVEGVDYTATYNSLDKLFQSQLKILESQAKLLDKVFNKLSPANVVQAKREEFLAFKKAIEDAISGKLKMIPDFCLQDKDVNIYQSQLMLVQSKFSSLLGKLQEWYKLGPDGSLEDFAKAISHLNKFKISADKAFSKMLDGEMRIKILTSSMTKLTQLQAKQTSMIDDAQLLLQETGVFQSDQNRQDFEAEMSFLEDFKNKVYFKQLGFVLTPALIKKHPELLINDLSLNLSQAIDRCKEDTQTLAERILKLEASLRNEVLAVNKQKENIPQLRNIIKQTAEQFSKETAEIAENLFKNEKGLGDASKGKLTVDLQILEARFKMELELQPLNPKQSLHDQEIFLHSKWATLQKIYQEFSDYKTRLNHAEKKASQLQEHIQKTESEIHVLNKAFSEEVGLALDNAKRYNINIVDKIQALQQQFQVKLQSKAPVDGEVDIFMSDKLKDLNKINQALSNLINENICGYFSEKIAKDLQEVSQKQLAALKTIDIPELGYQFSEEEQGKIQKVREFKLPVLNSHIKTQKEFELFLKETESRITALGLLVDNEITLRKGLHDKLKKEPSEALRDRLNEGQGLHWLERAQVYMGASSLIELLNAPDFLCSLKAPALIEIVGFLDGIKDNSNAKQVEKLQERIQLIQSLSKLEGLEGIKDLITDIRIIKAVPALESAGSLEVINNKLLHTAAFLDAITLLRLNGVILTKEFMQKLSLDADANSDLIKMIIKIGQQNHERLQQDKEKLQEQSPKALNLAQFKNLIEGFIQLDSSVASAINAVISQDTPLCEPWFLVYCQIAPNLVSGNAEEVQHKLPFLEALLPGIYEKLTAENFLNNEMQSREVILNHLNTNKLKPNLDLLCGHIEDKVAIAKMAKVMRVINTFVANTHDPELKKAIIGFRTKALPILLSNETLTHKEATLHKLARQHMPVNSRLSKGWNMFINALNAVLQTFSKKHGFFQGATSAAHKELDEQIKQEVGPEDTFDLGTIKKYPQ